ncbi:MAG: hypothetical protein U0903_13410 [Planctomycetales bacterium]
MLLSLRTLLYVICVLTDFSAFIVIFTVSRGLADAHTAAWYLGLIGAGVSFSAAMASLAGGWGSSRIGGKWIFTAGAVAILVSALCALRGDFLATSFLPFYWLLGAGIGLIYPPLIGWLNQGEDPHADHKGVSRRLILFCIAWNVGMMIGQLSGGRLYERGLQWAIGTAVATSLLNLGLVLVVVRLIARLPAPGEKQMEGAPAAPRMETAIRFKKLSWIANMGGVFGGSLVIHLLPDLMVLLGISAEAHGKLLAWWRVTIILTYIAMHLSRFWHYRLNVSLASQVLGACGLVAISWASSPEMLLFGLTLLGQLVGFNYFSGLYYSTAGSSHETRALSAGIHEATLATGMALGTVAGGVVGTLVGHRAPYFLAAVVLLILVLIQVSVWGRWKKFSPAES